MKDKFFIIVFIRFFNRNYIILCFNYFFVILNYLFFKFEVEREVLNINIILKYLKFSIVRGF